MKQKSQKWAELALSLALALLVLWPVNGCGPEGDDDDTTLLPGDDDATEPGDDDDTTLLPGDDDATEPGDDDATAPSVEDWLEIVGAYTDDYGWSHVITDDDWQMGEAPDASLFHVDSYVNSERYIIAQNDSSNQYNPDLWSRFDWVYVDAELWFCQAAYDAENRDVALAADDADSSDPAEGGCGGFSWTRLHPVDSPPEALEIADSYVDNYGMDHEITEASWTYGEAPDESLFHVLDWSNDEEHLVAQNDGDNAYFAGLWSRFDWTYRDGSLWYCQTVYDAPRPSFAEGNEAADHTSPAEGGCNGFPWSRLDSQSRPTDDLEIAGSYTDDYDGTHSISNASWTMGESPDSSVFYLNMFSNEDRYIIAQNGHDNAYNPALWSRFDWTWEEAALYYCQIEFAAESRSQALASEGADSSDPAAGGCGGFSWSKLTPIASERLKCSSTSAPADSFVDCVESYAPSGDPEQMFGYESYPQVVFGPPVGGGELEGSEDVLSLGCGGSITLFFDDPFIVDGPGPDFIVFENPFATGESTFVEPAVVSVSSDGLVWYSFPCQLSGDASWPPEGCAGIEPVIANVENGVDPLDLDDAGGDAFDLSDVGLAQARYVKLLDATYEYYGNSTWCGGSAAGFDLDAIGVVNGSGG